MIDILAILIMLAMIGGVGYFFYRLDKLAGTNPLFPTKIQFRTMLGISLVYALYATAYHLPLWLSFVTGALVSVAILLTM